MSGDLKSPGGVFAIRFFPIRKQITVLFIFRCIFSLLVICLCYHALHDKLIN